VRDEQSLEAIARAVDLGCNFFDTADHYGHGHSEAILGQALTGKRERVILATKGGSDFYHPDTPLNYSDSYLNFALEQSLKRLKTDYIDLYQLQNAPFTVIEGGRIFETLEKMKETGKIRFYGLSIHDPQQGLMAMRVGKPATLQVAYNALHQDAAEELFPEALKAGVGIIASEPLHNGFLTGKYTKDSVFPVGDIRHNWPAKYQVKLMHRVDDFLKTTLNSPYTPAQVALQFALRQQAVSTVIPGIKSLDQAEENLAIALEGLTPSSEA